MSERVTQPSPGYGAHGGNQENLIILAKIHEMSACDVFARLLWGEARGEMLRGQRAVANVVVNREADGRYGKGFKEVCLKPWQFSCFNPNDSNLRLLLNPPMREPYILIHRIAEIAIEGGLTDITSGATHYFNPQVVPGSWPASWDREKMVDCGRIGRHWFWREKS